jgi:hypothetical protein
MSSASEFFFGKIMDGMKIPEVPAEIVTKAEQWTHTPLDDQNRLRILRVNPLLIVEILNWCRKPSLNRIIAIPTVGEIPEGCEVVSVAPEWSSRSLQIMLRHPSFDVVPPGAPVPIDDIYWNLKRIYRNVENPEFKMEARP